jgi:cell division protein FtsB
MKIIRSKFFKYIAVLLIFGIWITFFDDYNLIKQGEMRTQLKLLREELQETKDAISRCATEDQKIKDDMEFIEKVGRDNYYMKSEDEDVYIFLEEDENGKLVPFEK